MVFAIPKREMNAECTLIFPYLYVRFVSHGGVGLYLNKANIGQRCALARI